MELDDEFHLVDHDPDSFDLNIKPIQEFESVDECLFKSEDKSSEDEDKNERNYLAIQDELLKCKEMAEKQVATIALLQRRVSTQETAIESCTISLMATTVQQQTAEESVARLEKERDMLLTLNAKYVDVVKYLEDKTAELKTLSKAEVRSEADIQTKDPNSKDIEAVVHNHSTVVAHVLSLLQTKATAAEENLSKCEASLASVQQEAKQSLAQLKTDRDRFRNRSTQLEEELNRKVYELNTFKEFHPVPNRRPRPIDHAMYAAHGPPRAFMHELFDPSLFR